MYRIFFSVIICLAILYPASIRAQSSELQSILQANHKAVERASRKTLGPLLQSLTESKLNAVPSFLEKWRNKQVWLRKSDGQFVFVDDNKADLFDLVDISSGKIIDTAPKAGLKQLKPNSGVRSIIAAALVQFQLIADAPDRRISALSAIERDPDASHLNVLRSVVKNEQVLEIKSRMTRLERLLTIRFDKDDDARVRAIKSFAGDTNVDVRAVLNPILQTETAAALVFPDNKNIASRLSIGQDITALEAYNLLVGKTLAPAPISIEARNAALVANLIDGKVAGFKVNVLNTQTTRIAAYQVLAIEGLVPPFVTDEVRAEFLNNHVFFKYYNEPNKAVTDAAENVLKAINNWVSLFGIIDLSMDGLSLASIYFLAAIGLAITFGVMGVINMAHGEFIMIGAYTGYLVQQFVPNYTLSIVIALPLAFCVAFAAGVLLERLVIRHLMHRPLETLLATFGISIALQQLAKNIFGTQARPLTSPDWLSGSWIVNDVISISYIRIAIFLLSLTFLFLLLFILKKTRLGLEVRAVTQNPKMASSMGINPDKINMLTFGLGSGIAGIAGVAIGLFAQVTSELGSGYIVQSFMTVVVGGVGSIWGTLAGASMIGGLQKIIEWFNPSNTLAAQTYMIIFITIFIQFKPKGIVALKGRAAGD